MFSIIRIASAMWSYGRHFPLPIPAVKLVRITRVMLITMHAAPMGRYLVGDYVLTHGGWCAHVVAVDGPTNRVRLEYDGTAERVWIPASAVKGVIPELSSTLPPEPASSGTAPTRGPSSPRQRPS